MSDFSSYRKVKARKPHRCEHCRKLIGIGEEHKSVVGVFDGDFSAYRAHFECDAAWLKLNFDLRDYPASEGAPFLADDEYEPDDKDWMREAFPIVAERLGWSAA